MIEEGGSAETQKPRLLKSSPSSNFTPPTAPIHHVPKPPISQVTGMTTAMAQSLESRPTVVDFRDDSPWVQLAKAHWLDAKVRKAKPDVIKKQLWDPLEAEAFSSRSLLILENLNILEK